LTDASEALAIRAVDLSKKYRIYDSPADRLKDALIPFKKHYHRDFYALDGVSFELAAGQAYGIIGFNGSGKSTLLKIICGVTQPTAGRVEVKGKISALLELGAGFNPEFTGRQNIFFSGVLAGMSHAEIEACYDDIVVFAEIGKFIDQPVKSYSSGMLMRLAFAVAIHVDPEILVIDEALAVGDARFQNKCMARIRELKERCTILFVSHDMNAVLTLCDQALWLNQGKTVMAGDPKEIARLYTEAIYEGVDKVMARRQARLRPSLLAEPVPEGGDDGESHGPETATPIGEEEIEAAESFGQGKARIFSSRLLGVDGLRKETVCRGEQLSLVFDLQLKEALEQPIVGFGISNRLGLMIIGVHDPLEKVEERELFQAGGRVTVRYDFCWPDLEPGAYAFTVAIADGIMENHRQQHWIHEALMVDCIRDEGLDGMLGLDYSLKVTREP